MKLVLDAGIFKENLKRSFGIVNDKNIQNQFQSFYFKIIGGFLYIAGSDGSITFLSKMKPNKIDDRVDDISFVISASTLFNLVRDTSNTIELDIGEGNCAVRTEYGVTTLKLISEDYFEINFTSFDITEVDDVFDAQELSYYLSSLSPIMASTAIDSSFLSIFADGKKFYATDGNIVSYIFHPTNKRYVFKAKDTQCLIDVIGTSEGKVTFKYVDEGTSVLVKIGNAVFTFRCYEEEDMLDISQAVENSNFSIACLFDKKDFLKKVQYSLLTSTGNIDLTLTKNEAVIYCENEEGEESTYATKLLKTGGVDGKIKFSVLASNLIKLVKICREDKIIVNLNLESNRLRLTDLAKKTLSVMSINN